MKKLPPNEVIMVKSKIKELIIKRNRLQKVIDQINCQLIAVIHQRNGARANKHYDILKIAESNRECLAQQLSVLSDIECDYSKKIYKLGSVCQKVRSLYKEHNAALSRLQTIRKQTIQIDANIPGLPREFGTHISIDNAIIALESLYRSNIKTLISNIEDLVS